MFGAYYNYVGSYSVVKSISYSVVQSIQSILGYSFEAISKGLSAENLNNGQIIILFSFSNASQKMC